jgi:hypothetical protein
MPRFRASSTGSPLVASSFYDTDLFLADVFDLAHFIVAVLTTAKALHPLRIIDVLQRFTILWQQLCNTRLFEKS